MNSFLKLNTPNKLIILRLFLALAVVSLLLAQVWMPEGVFVYYCHVTQAYVSYFNPIAGVLFVLAAFTDYLDGKLARKNNQITEFGKLFDPIADKIVVNSVLIIFAVFSRLPVWLVIIFVTRDILVEGLRISVSSQGKVLAADKLGKMKTLWQFIGLTILFVWYPESVTSTSGFQHFNYNSIYHLFLIPIYIGGIYSVLSGINYYKKNLGALTK